MGIEGICMGQECYLEEEIGIEEGICAKICHLRRKSEQSKKSLVHGTKQKVVKGCKK